MTDPESEIARIEKMINSPATRTLRDRVRETPGHVRPRNAATMIVVDGKGKKARILMGKRIAGLKFMPGAMVFPGGSVDRYDGSAPSVDGLPEVTNQKLKNFMRGPGTDRGARALGMAAIRETAEESGLLIGVKRKPDTQHKDWADFQNASITPRLSGLRLFSRAITPPGLARRFDTWFFVCHAEEIGHVPEGGFDPCGELEKLEWLTPQEAISGQTREITRVMLAELIKRLEKDPDLDPGYPAPYYHYKYRRFQRELM